MPADNDDGLVFKADDPKTYVYLATALARLKISQPEFYREFVKAFDSVLTHHGRNIGMMHPDPTLSIHAQGRLRALMVLSSVVDGCMGIVKGYEANKEKKDGTRAELAARAARN